MFQILDLTEKNFDQEVLQSDVPVLVDFWSPSCGPCRMLVPVLNALAEENGENVKIVKVNVAECQKIGAKYEIDMLPTLLFFDQGNIVARMVGVQTKDKIQDTLDEID